MNALHVVRGGALTTVQDGGRPGFAHLAVPPSGALDRPAFALANRLVGNGPDAAVLETTLDGVAVRCDDDRTVAVTGAPAEVRGDGRAIAWGEAVRLPAGVTLDVGRATAGLRSYVAIGGGIDGEAIFGSRSRDLLSAIGPPPLSDGDELRLGPPGARAPAVDVAPQIEPAQRLELTLWSGPRSELVTDAGRDTLRGTGWTVSSASNRIGLRLDGQALVLASRPEMDSEPMVTGAVQIPPDGRPIIFLADHPTTGGYPVIGVVEEPDLAACAQARPGIPVCFRTRTVTW